jgi:hypothetical protein
MNSTIIETSWRKRAKSRKHPPTFTTNEFKERIKAICGVRPLEDQPTIRTPTDHGYYPPQRSR